jgi:phosphatidylserine/phosphatidylglycerophosphate/cardiolipin synthase-like enzyme
MSRRTVGQAEQPSEWPAEPSRGRDAARATLRSFESGQPDRHRRFIRTPDLPTLRSLADLAFSRAAGAPLVSGNSATVLRNGAENYPRWEQAIERAQRSIHLEMYIIHADATGRRFVDLLAAKARDGVAVRVIYDWFGCGLTPLFGLFRKLIAAGAEVRCFNPPTPAAILGWTRRDHRKLLTVDGRVAFVSGLCIGDDWVGRPEKHRAPWRDTGVEIAGPAVAYAEHAFADSWRFTGGTFDNDTITPADSIAPAGDVSLRLIPTEPFTWNMLHLDLLVTALARQTLWITDAYFLGHGPYVEALCRAAHDGVDVRLLLPQGSDVGWTVPASRTLYRTLLENGVRIFEWNGLMIHAKTAAADSRWARIGSTNLNLSSWLGNWELDVAIENDEVARTLEQQYELDLAESTEIVLGRRRGHAQFPMNPRARARRSARRVMRTVSGLGRSIGAAVTGNRRLEEFEFAPLFWFGTLLAVISALGIFYPRAMAWPIAALAGWSGVSFVIEALTLWLRRRDR